jgi:hypothetical protein
MEVVVEFVEEKLPDRSSNLIELSQGRDYSHVLINYFDLAESVDKIFHCIGRGVCTEYASEFYNTHNVVISKQVQLECEFEEFKMLTMLWDNVPYSLAQFVNCALDRLGMGFIEWSDNEKEGMICSELVARVLHKWSDYKFNEDMDSIEPIDVEAVLFGVGIQ